MPQQGFHGLSCRGTRILAGLVLLLLFAASSSARGPASPGSSAVSQSAAKNLAAKIAMLSNPNPSPSSPLQPVTITENEANSYLKLRGNEFLPPAVEDPEIRIQADQVAASADVNFDELGQMRSQNSEDWSSKLFAYVFKGKQHVTATGTLETGDGQGKLTLTSFKVGSISLPAAFVNFLLQSYVENQYHIDLSKPFPLPPKVTHIELASGRATLHRLALSRR